MDLVTQGVLGAAVGYAVAGHKLGRASLVLGALGGMLPDVDVLWTSGNEVAYWASHRGITHSLFFWAGGRCCAGLVVVLSRYQAQGVFGS